MAWRTIAENDLLQKMNSSEFDAVADVVDGVIEQVVDMVRGYIASNPRNTLDATAATLPERLIGPACSVIVVDAYSSQGGMLIDLGETRAKAKDEALRLFRDVAAGRFSIEDAETGEEGTETIPPYYVPGKPCRRFDRASQEGL